MLLPQLLTPHVRYAWQIGLSQDSQFTELKTNADGQNQIQNPTQNTGASISNSAM